ncbi:type IX secretion system membrane protein PorP/SprF [Marinoscillum furvescens]|uniref:Type IX secretion system PorP/SprF family membrane protein n=1 Tax=Marinoscillum furvescens DSM 4134 TaxID=1122208 RepID=A0A3D9KYL6_MARFU|nr:type IX secretion system membrane protein PorP/SprF [Marinoscillum furvescens]RED92321.1 type IX secretion system PorP/SprF family membrane protein [Marinoscillum furvescens DSM 4134]
MKRLVTLIVSFALVQGLSAQDYLGSSSYYLNPFSINTAYSAMGGAFFTAFQANKYTGSQSQKGAEYISFAGYYDLGRGMAGGLRMNSQSLGMINYQTVDLSLSYSAGINEDHYLSFSLAPGLLREILEQQDVQYSPYVDQNDPLLNGDNSYDRTVVTLGGGLVYNVYKFQMSFFMPNLVRGNESLKADFTGYMKYTYTDHKSIYSVENYGLIRYFHDGSYFYDAGLLVGYNNMVWLNGAYRSNSSANIGLAFSTKDIRFGNFKFGYNYNHPFGEFNELISGKHELTLTFGREDLRGRSPYFHRKRR